MSDEFPSRSCADVLLSRDGTGEGEDRYLPASLVPGRDRKSREVLTRLTRESEILWAVRKVALWMVVQRPDGQRSE
jgi:hypothetical protein